MGMPLPMARRGLLIALRQRITCAHVRLEVGWRAGGAKEPRASLCVWYAFGVTGEENHGPSRRPLAAAPRPRLRSLRCFVRLPAAPPQPALPLDRACDARRFSSDPSRPDSCVDASNLVLEHEPCHELELAGAARRPLALIVPWTTRRRVGRRPAE